MGTTGINLVGIDMGTTRINPVVVDMGNNWNKPYGH